MLIKQIIFTFSLLFLLFFHCSFVYLEKPAGFNPKVEVVGCFLEYEDKILLLHRQDLVSQGNLWGIPGGKLEKGETAEMAGIRETFEETGFDISKQPMKSLGKVYIKYPSNDFIYHMVSCKACTPPANVRISFREHKGFTWVTPQDALKMSLMLDEDECIKLIYSDECF